MTERNKEIAGRIRQLIETKKGFGHNWTYLEGIGSAIDGLSYDLTDYVLEHGNLPHELSDLGGEITYSWIMDAVMGVDIADKYTRKRTTTYGKRSMRGIELQSIKGKRKVRKLT